MRKGEWKKRSENDEKCVIIRRNLNSVKGRNIGRKKILRKKKGNKLMKKIGFM